MKQLTPYDTGERAEPHVWPVDPTDHDGYGLVDFDNDEGTTVATVVVRRDESGGYVLEVTGHGPDLTVKDCGVM